jgi:hypothetical protein
MPLVRYAVFILLIPAAALLTGARNSHRTTPSSRPANAAAHAAAVNTLDEALVRLDPRHAVWLETKIWQKGKLNQFTYEADGRYLAGPNHQLRLELTTRHGRASSASLTVSDGVTLWQGNHLGEGSWTDLKRVDLHEVLRALNSTAPPRVRDDILRGHAFSGVVPLLHTLRSRLVWSRKESIRRGGRTFIKLSGTWSAEARAAVAPPDQPWPDGLPRQCRSYLDPATLWPHRIEWWGPDAAHAPDVLLLQIEFRDPLINQPPSAERRAQEFKFPVAVDQAFNLTPELIERARQMLAQPASSD